MADRVEEPAGGVNRGQVDVGVQDGLLVLSGSSQDLAGGMDDHAVAVFHPASVAFLASALVPHHIVGLTGFEPATP